MNWFIQTERQDYLIKVHGLLTQSTFNYMRTYFWNFICLNQVALFWLVISFNKNLHLLDTFYKIHCFIKKNKVAFFSFRFCYFFVTFHQVKDIIDKEGGGRRDHIQVFTWSRFPTTKKGSLWMKPDHLYTSRSHENQN